MYKDVMGKDELNILAHQNNVTDFTSVVITTKTKAFVTPKDSRYRFAQLHQSIKKDFTEQNLCP